MKLSPRLLVWMETQWEYMRNIREVTVPLNRVHATAAQYIRQGYSIASDTGYSVIMVKKPNFLVKALSSLFWREVPPRRDCWDSAIGVNVLAESSSFLLIVWTIAGRHSWQAWRGPVAPFPPHATKCAKLSHFSRTEARKPLPCLREETTNTRQQNDSWMLLNASWKLLPMVRGAKSSLTGRITRVRAFSIEEGFSRLKGCIVHK